MNDVKTDLKGVILSQIEAASDGDDPLPPTSYFMGNIEIIAMSAFENRHALSEWMRARGLDPSKGPDAVLGLGLLLTLEDKRNPRPDYEHYEMPDDHDH